tara:strand:- start:9723 stop:10394 length:672 start_codon:yes stop_codon:yes gene_type:complete
VTAIVLVSGGMDSAAIIGLAAKKYNDLAFLHITYGQNTAQKERECFEKLANHYKVPKHKQKIIDISFLRQIGGSSLTDEQIEVTNFQGDSDQIPSSYVPFRNTHIIACAVSWAEVIGASKIYIGANEEDSPGYPDCRPSYYQAYNELIKQGTKDGSVSIETPVISMTKSEIIKLANQNQVPLELTWSCYRSNDLACGTCDSCALRLRGFKKLNLKDPISYVNS